MGGLLLRHSQSLGYISCLVPDGLTFNMTGLHQLEDDDFSGETTR